MRNPVLVAAVAAGKASALATRLLGRGGGTALPGLVAQAVYPRVLRDLTAQLPEGSVMVTGTNGKTTTSRMLGSILEAAGLRPLHNRSGSNLERGLIATLVDAATPSAGLPGSLRVGLLEVDEATVPAVLPAVRPRVALFNNLFRDQLDRYGEIDTVYGKWRGALPRLSPGATLVLNADDPAIAYLAQTQGLRSRTCTFGIDDSRYVLKALPHAADSISCPRCNSRLRYDLVLLSHLGHWSCPNCGLERPRPDVAAMSVSLHGTDNTGLYLRTPAGEMQVTLKVPGLYNVYNGLAAVSAALALGIPPADIKAGLEGFTAAFGRIERVSIPVPGNKSLLMALVKNPVGFNEVLRMLFPVGEAALKETMDDGRWTMDDRQSGSSPGTAHPKHLLIIINDLTADGRDVSWLWDVDFELLSATQGSVASVHVSGIRSGDMAVRLKYAGIDPSMIKVESALPEALDAAVHDLPAGETLYVCPTYTSMLAFRKLLHSRGWVQSQFWEQ
jgi:lipid II isoglutaminyl synthase (glutamine-hydrolysing)